MNTPCIVYDVLCRLILLVLMKILHLAPIDILGSVVIARAVQYVKRRRLTLLIPQRKSEKETPKTFYFVIAAIVDFI